MVSSGGAVSDGGVSGLNRSSQNLKKGPWTAAEDVILMAYVKKHGEGNWNSVQKNSGLMRCGKSCRLRWTNHLRPNLKKGSFTPEEERIIIELHAKLGNKWARMAAQLPGRTDNEIKNYWNTRTKRRQRAGLPIYPQEIQEKAVAFHLQHHHRRSHNNSPLSSLLTSQNPTYNPSLSPFDTFNFSSAANNPLQNQPTSSFSIPDHQFKISYDNNNGTNGFSFPLSPNSSFVPSATSLFNQNHHFEGLPASFFKFNSGNNFDRDLSFSSMIMGAGGSVDPLHHFVPGMGSNLTELPSSQTALQAQPMTSASSRSTTGVCAMESNTDHEIISPKTTIDNSGLLDALVQESQKLSREEKINSDNLSVLGDKGKGVVGVASEEEECNEGVEAVMRNSDVANADTQRDNLDSSQSSIETKAREDPFEEMNSMDDDLVTLLNNFPLSMPLPEWYSGNREISYGPSTPMIGCSNVDINHQQNAPITPASTSAASPDFQWPMGSYCWNNMPSIC